MPLIDVDGAKLYYETAGDQTKPAILFLHSLGCALGMYDQQVAALQDDYSLIRYDVRGHGKSAVLDDREASIARLTEDALAVLDAAGVRRAHWCGVSLGAMCSMWAAARHADRTITATIANTGARSGTPEHWQARIENVKNEGMEAIAKIIEPRWFTERFIASGSPLVGQIMQQVRDCDPRGYNACCAAIRDMDQSEQLKTIRLPVLVIAGAKDPATPPAMAENIRAGIPGAKLVALDAAHLSNVEAAAEFTRVLREFIATPSVSKS